MKSLFDTSAIGSLELANRIIRSATWEGLCDKDGRPTRKLEEYYGCLIRGGVGLIITGYGFVRPDGKQNPWSMGIHTDDFEHEFKRLADSVHGAGGKVIIQLFHAGNLARPNETGLPKVAPSPVPEKLPRNIPRTLSGLEIEDLTDSFARAAGRARQWGFDGVQLHGAHGYLINQFLSPVTNQRSDAYGGSLENRIRFLTDIYEKTRNRVGHQYPILIKLNITDHVENGITTDEGLRISQRLSDLGIDAIEVSSGSGASGKKGPARLAIDSKEKEAYNLKLAAAVKKEVSCPVISVGGFRSLSIAQKAVAEHETDFIAMSRPFIREPDLVKGWHNNTAKRSECISCNRCFMPGMKKESGIACVALEKKTHHHNSN